MEESKSRLISELEEHINVISFPQVIQGEFPRLELETTAAESEVVRISDEFTGKAEMTRTAKTRKDLRQLSTSRPTNSLVCDMELTFMNESSMQALSLIELHEHLNSSQSLVSAIRNYGIVGFGGGTGETLSVADGFEQHSSTLTAIECHECQERTRVIDYQHGR